MIFEQIEPIRDALGSIPLQRLYITGGNIFGHSAFDKILALFNDIKDYCVFGFHYLNMPEEQIWRRLAGYHVELFITPFCDMRMIQKCIQAMERYHVNYLLKLTVTSSKELKIYEQLTKTFPESVTIVAEPLFTGENHDFFDAHIFMEKEDIFEQAIPLHQIFTNQILNKNFFGSLYIDADGTTKSNPNNKKILGNISNGSFYPLIAEELINNYAWKKIRNKKPCVDCLYNCLCPSISNYELALQKYDLCHIHTATT
jgi:pseudo-rSAM protein